MVVYFRFHYCDVIMGMMASQITSLTIVYSIVHSGADQRILQSSVSLAFVWGIHRWPVNSSHKWPVMQKTFSFDDVIMYLSLLDCISHGYHIVYKKICLLITLWSSFLEKTKGDQNGNFHINKSKGDQNANFHINKLKGDQNWNFHVNKSKGDQNANFHINNMIAITDSVQ